MNCKLVHPLCCSCWALLRTSAPLSCPTVPSKTSRFLCCSRRIRSYTVSIAAAVGNHHSNGHHEDERGGVVVRCRIRNIQAQNTDVSRTSIESAMKKRTTSIGRNCPSRWIRSIAWNSTAGFHLHESVAEYPERTGEGDRQTGRHRFRDGHEDTVRRR